MTTEELLSSHWSFEVEDNERLLNCLLLLLPMLVLGFIGIINIKKAGWKIILALLKSDG